LVFLDIERDKQLITILQQNVKSTYIKNQVLPQRRWIFWYFKCFLGLSSVVDFFDLGWGLRGSSTWSSLLYNQSSKSPLTKLLLENTRFLFKRNRKKNNLLSLFYKKTINLFEKYYLVQEFKLKWFLRWAFVLDLRILRSILNNSLSPDYFFRLLFSFKTFFLILYQIFMPLKVPKHPFHLVSHSPWPLYTSLAALVLVLGLVQYFHSFSSALFTLTFAFIYLVIIVSFWWRDVIREGTFQGMHTKIVQKGLKIGMLLFILSEVMFFVAFFWAFFHSSLAPTIEIGSIWPPAGFEPFNPWGIPLINTFFYY